MSDALRVGIGGPVGAGKTALMDWLCKRMRGRYEIAAITNDIHTREDAEFLPRSGALPPERIRGVETGGCPHTAIREDASIKPCGGRRDAPPFPGSRSDPDRVWRRQPCCDLFPRARRSDDLLDRCRRWRQDPAQKPARNHPLRPPPPPQNQSPPPGRPHPPNHF